MPGWIWPKTVRSEPNVIVRIGRVLHWAGLFFGALGALMFLLTVGRDESVAVSMVPLTLLAPLGGRALRYVLANE